MKQVFINHYSFDDVKISRKPIYVEDGIISEAFEIDKDVEVIDCENLALVPAFTDLHVHFRDPGFTYKEDLESGSKAALKGGFTSVLLMGNTKPTVSSPECFSLWRVLYLMLKSPIWKEMLRLSSLLGMATIHRTGGRRRWMPD